MSQRLQGKVALITGAGGGIGGESALLFAAEGAAVVAVDVDESAANECARRVKAARTDAAAMDAADVLAPLRARFDLARADAEGVIYLDGNSLGALPAATAARVRQVA